MPRRVYKPKVQTIETQILIAEAVVAQYRNYLADNEKTLERLRARPEMAGEWGWPRSIEAAEERIAHSRLDLIAAEEKLAGLKRRQKEG